MKRDINKLISDLNDCIWKLDSFAEFDEERELLDDLREISEGFKEIADDLNWNHLN